MDIWVGSIFLAIMNEAAEDIRVPHFAWMRADFPLVPGSAIAGLYGNSMHIPF